MSVKIMGMVFDCDLPRDEKYVLLSYADHAAHDGTSIYPSAERMAWKTGYTIRSIRSITKKLVAQGILIRDGKGPNNVNRWRIDIEKLPKRAEYRSSRGENFSPLKMQKTATEGEKFSPNPSLTVIEPSHGADAPIQPLQEKTGEALIEQFFGERPECTSAPQTPHWTTRISEGWTEWGADSKEMQRQLIAFGERGRAVQRLGYKLDKQFAMRPLWDKKNDVKSWMSGLSICLDITHGNEKLVIGAARTLIEAGLTVSDPWSLHKKTRAIVAEKERGARGLNAPAQVPML